MAKPVVTVLGSNGPVGIAIVRSLSSLHSDKVSIKAGTRHPEKAFGLASLPGVDVIEADMGASNLVEVLKPFKPASVFIVTPGGADAAYEIAVRAVRACKAAGVQTVAVISDGFADIAGNSVFGRLSNDMERTIKETGIPYVFLRLPPYLYDSLLRGSLTKETSTSE